ncbi:probable CCR4-associated factor 1 homolog 11 [Typha angustifolia]|uniref:probable CCR4-associated factor 1 homolog 11 n=1 Tax=Typha angustifolia TaxID=59011 RepID=UPI003C3079DD
MSCNVQVRSVWRTNVEYEFRLIGSLVSHFTFVSIDTEFPGIVYASPHHPSLLTPDDRYALMKKNVDALHLIQVGITLSDADGRLPDLGTRGAAHFVWEFNICNFNIHRDLHSSDSINLLINQGINLERLHNEGIDSWHFAHLLLFKSGLLCNNAINWITFHSAYDFGYLAKALLRSNLPNNLEQFMQFIRVYFRGQIFDVKNIIRYCNGIYGGLEKTASLLGIERTVGRSHHSGSDALLISLVFKRLREIYFARDGSLHRHAGLLYGVQIY